MSMFPRVAACNCVNPQFPCQACGAGISDWHVWQIPNALPPRYVPPAPSTLTTKPAYFLTGDQIEDLIERAVRRAIENAPRGGTKLREQLADYAHEAWCGWMAYMFGRSAHNPDGSVTIPRDLVSRWQRQIITPYADLSEPEKDSDRAEADRMLAIIERCEESE